jgi:hypothetical protein
MLNDPLLATVLILMALALLLYVLNNHIPGDGRVKMPVNVILFIAALIAIALVWLS